MRYEKGSIGDFTAACVCMLMMSILLFTYMDSVQLLNQKEDVGQVVRKYILRMETVGLLTDEDRVGLCGELEGIGASELDLTGTSFQRVGYGETVVLHVRGKLRGKYDFEENRVSTAKY